MMELWKVEQEIRYMEKNLMDKINIKKKKILFLSNHFITLYSFRKELINKLLSDNCEVYVSMPKSEDNIYFKNLGCIIIETQIDRRGVNPIKDLSLLISYFRIIKDVKPDLIFSYTIKPNIYGAIAANILKVKQICNITGTGNTFLHRSLISRIVILLYKVSVKHSYKVYFQNTGDKDFFVINNMIKNNWELLPGSGVNLKEYALASYPSDDCINFIFIGRVMQLKGIDEYLEAAKYIREHYDKTHFFIAGWNEEKRYIRYIKEYCEKGYVEYIGFQNDIKKWIKKCHCTILPSHGGEGIPNVLLESAAMGRVCIASNINGSKEVIDNGKSGYLFKVANQKDLIEKIECFLKLSHKEKYLMGLAGHRKVEKEFDREFVIQKYMREIYYEK